MKNVNVIIYDNSYNDIGAISLQMDFAAIRIASDSDFQVLGVRRRGDILALRSFVLSDEETLKQKRKGRKENFLN